MANRSNLVGHYSSKALSPNDLGAVSLLTANYQIPITWLSLFSVPDLTSCTAEAMDGAGVVSSVVVPTVLAPAQQAAERSRSRERTLLSVLPDRVHHHIAEWYSLLPLIREPYLQLDAFEIWCMDAPEVFEQFFPAYLRAMDNPDDSAWSGILEQARVGEPEVERWGIRGYAWSIKAPWGKE